MSYYLGIGADVQANSATNTLSNIFMYFKNLKYNLTTPIFILFILGSIYFLGEMLLGIDKIFKNKKIQKIFFLFLWIVLPLMIIGYMESGAYAQPRYTMPQYPFFILIAISPLFKIGGLLKKHFKINKKIITISILIILVMAFIPNLLWANQLTKNKLPSYYELKPAGEWIKANSEPGDMVITNSFPQISYYSERKVATFGNCYDNPESHTGGCSEEEFHEFVADVKPKFLVWSVFQHHKEWIISYLQNNNIWTPIQVYKQGEQSIIVIYEADYS
jgi:hypothetical protein